jgi:S-adenosylmethionine:tRNA-ribosyltransferase-isomerase (queuine synthetase)
VVAGKDGAIRVANQMQVNLTCDHRTIYGAHAAAFLKDLAQLIETNPESLALLEPRHAARLLAVDPLGMGPAPHARHLSVWELQQELQPGDLLVLEPWQPQPGETSESGQWLCLAKPAKKLKPGDGLEAVAQLHGGELRPHTGPVNLVIQPGYRFAVVQGLLTNFHLPKSSLLLLVSALIGRERLLALYAEAIARQYRFFSYGDAMWIAPEAVSAGAQPLGRP